MREQIFNSMTTEERRGVLKWILIEELLMIEDIEDETI
jgi:hypothetical protein